jgi:signal transduction histidine kinase
MRARHEDGRITVVIEDDGRGFDVANPNGSERTRGMGLDAIRLRARMIDAVLVLHSRPGQGTRIELSIPINPHEDTDG